MEKKLKNKKKLGIGLGVIGAVIVAVFVVFASTSIIPGDIKEKNIPENIDTDTDTEEWHIVAQLDSDNLDALGEASPGSGASGWLSTFLLDYEQDPGTVLAVNGTDWSSDANTMGYVDTDDTNSDITSEDPFYFVVRARFNDNVKDGSDFIGSRCRCTLTVDGDETISGVAQLGDDTGADNNGGGCVSQNGTSYIYINFWWDDNSDGYRITDDGGLTWSITLEAKY